MGALVGDIADVVGELSLEKFLGLFAVHCDEGKMLQIEYGITGQGRLRFRAGRTEAHDT